MKYVVCFIIVFCMVGCLVVYAAESPEVASEVNEGQGGEGEVIFPSLEDIVAGVVAVFDAREDVDSGMEEVEETVTDEEFALQNPPQLEGFQASPEGIQQYGISDVAVYPYTGGSFIFCQTNVGTGVVFVAEPYKVNTFGFMKGTDRVVNLTTGTVSGYWIMGGTTYSLRFTALGQAQYYRQSGSSWYWTDIVVNSILDTNIQYLDETGERGIQRPALSITDKVLFIFIIFSLILQGATLLKRR